MNDGSIGAGSIDTLLEESNLISEIRHDLNGALSGLSHLEIIGWDYKSETLSKLTGLNQNLRKTVESWNTLEKKVVNNLIKHYQSPSIEDTEIKDYPELDEIHSGLNELRAFYTTMAKQFILKIFEGVQVLESEIESNRFDLGEKYDGLIDNCYSLNQNCLAVTQYLEVLETLSHEGGKAAMKLYVPLNAIKSTLNGEKTEIPPPKDANEESVTRVAYADDEQTARKIMAGMLGNRSFGEESHAYHLTIYPDGNEMIKEMAEMEPGTIILTDREMPTSGFEVLKAAQKHPHLIVKAMVSGKGTQEDIQKAHELGAHHYFHKPIRDPLKFEGDLYSLIIKNKEMMAHKK